MWWTKRENLILNVLKTKTLSPSHGFDHLENVASYAVNLAKKYHGNRDLVVAAALLHDLGRSKPHLHGKKSALYSARLARPILKKVGYSQKETRFILQAILDHDQPSLSSNLLEARILKDADFLDGFGMRGLLRAVYYTAEAGEPLAKVIERLTIKMAKRYRGLEFPETRQLAQEDYNLTKLLVAYLKIKTQFRNKIYQGRLIVFEGISGTGKETQAKRLSRYLRAQGRSNLIIHHPTPNLKEMLNLWRKEKRGLFPEAFFFIGDRFDSTQKKILPALKAGKIVISLRNRVSTLVYQVSNRWQEELIDYLYSIFEPVPDAIFYFYLKPETALARIEKRTKETGEKKGRFEKLVLLKKKQNRYKRILKDFKNVIQVDASKSVDEVHQHIVHSILKLWQKKAD